MSNDPKYDEIRNRVTGGTATPTPKPKRPLEVYSTSDLRQLWRADRLTEAQWKAELIARGESDASATDEIAKQKNVGVSTAAKTAGQLTASEAAAVASLRSSAPKASDAAKQLQADYAHIKPGVGDFTPESESVAAEARASGGAPAPSSGAKISPPRGAGSSGQAATSTTATKQSIKQQQAEAFIAANPKLIKEVKRDAKGNVTSMVVYQQGSQMAQRFIWDADLGDFAPSDAKPFQLTREGLGVSDAQRAITGTTRKDTVIPLGGEFGETPRLDRISSLMGQDRSPVGMYDVPFVPRDPLNGQTQQDYRDSLIDGPGYIPHTVNQDSSMSFLGANGAGGLGMDRYNTSALGMNYTTGTQRNAAGTNSVTNPNARPSSSTVLSRPSSVQDAIQSNLLFADIIANLPPEQQGNQNLIAARATEAGLMTRENLQKFVARNQGLTPQVSGRGEDEVAAALYDPFNEFNGLGGFADGGGLKLQGPAMIVDMATGRPVAIAAEAGKKENVRATEAGLKFTPTDEPIKGFADGGTLGFLNEEQKRLFGLAGYNFDPAQGQTQPTGSFDNSFDINPPQTGPFNVNQIAPVAPFQGPNGTGGQVAPPVPSLATDAAQQNVLNLANVHQTARETEFGQLEAARNNTQNQIDVARSERDRSALNYRYGMAGLPLPTQIERPIAGDAPNLPPGLRYAPETEAQNLNRKFSLEDARRNLAMDREQLALQQARASEAGVGAQYDYAGRRIEVPPPEPPEDVAAKSLLTKILPIPLIPGIPSRATAAGNEVLWPASYVTLAKNQDWPALAGALRMSLADVLAVVNQNKPVLPAGNLENDQVFGQGAA